MAKQINLAQLFGVEGIITPKTLVNETKDDVLRKKPNEAGEDIKVLLDEISIRIVSRDIVGVEDCLKAIQMRVDYMRETAEQIKKAMGK